MRIQRIEPKKQELEKEDVDLSLIDPVIDKFKGRKGILIPLLQNIQNVYGYIPPQSFKYVAGKTDLRLADMYGVATFYTQFRLKPVGKYIIKVCHGTACHVQGAKAITEALADSLKIKDGETTEDKLFTLESVACLGCCSLAPVMMINDDTHGSLTGKSATKIIRNLKLQEKN
ncbi:MAG TPA: NADH-quinone oxidoreductase subunit NuoE [Bacteroidales bacterium]|nr:NADH-quinone oxidoreductase subunit NuoE [Bacteroidales bacterium]